MFSILLIAEKNEGATDLRSQLTRKGFTCYLAGDGDEAVAETARQAPDLVLVEVSARSRARELWEQIKPEKHLPVLGLVNQGLLANVNGHLDAVDDFAVAPYNVTELELRIKRLLSDNTRMGGEEPIRCGDLVIDLARCEVTLAGKHIELTFREYELLKFLAGNGGRVYTREALLNKVWGYDYYGGDRTVDVHVRRLRSKIEDSDHTFIETVRNIGYRFRKNS